MIRTLACAMLILAVGIGGPSLASPPEKFQKECVKTLKKTQKNKPRSEHEAFCQCVAEGGQRLGLSRYEFAVERVRLENSEGSVSGGRIRQVSARCEADLNQPKSARTGF